MTQFYLLEGIKMILIEYAGMGSCGNNITLYRKYNGKYQQILDICGAVGSIGQKIIPKDFYLWLHDGLYRYEWNAQKENYYNFLIRENSRDMGLE